MAKFVATLTQLKVGGVDLSDHVETATITAVGDEVETTAFGATYHDFLMGLSANTLTVVFQQDYGIAKVQQTIWPLLNTTTTFSALPVAGATSSVNPAFTGNVLISNWTPIDAQIGALGKVSATWKIVSAVTQATT